jgi:hypothetical protein
VVHQLLTYRNFISEYYPKYLSLIKQTLTDLCRKKKIEVNDRLVLNMVSIIGPYIILQEKTGTKFPWTYEELLDYAVNAIYYQQTLIDSGNDIDVYLQVLQSCVGKDLIDGEHFVIKDKYLYLRFSPSVSIYSQAAIRQGIKPLDKTTLKNYLEVSTYYLEKAERVWFHRLRNTPACVKLDYTKMQDAELDFITASFASNQEERALQEKSKYDVFKLYINGLQTNQNYDEARILDKINAVPGLTEPLSKGEFNRYVSQFNQESTIQIDSSRNGILNVSSADGQDIF